MLEICVSCDDDDFFNIFFIERSQYVSFASRSESRRNLFGAWGEPISLD